MVEIRYQDQFEVSELAGQTVSEAREQFKAEFGIPNKAQAKLNGLKVKSGAEIDTVLTDDDKLTFVVSRSKGAYLVGALLLALTVTGSIFAAGFINNTATINVGTINSNFADVTANASAGTLTWGGFGFYKGTIAGTGSEVGIFNITPAAGYPSDLVTTVTLSNADELSKVYRVLALRLEMVVADVPVDISAGAGNTVAMLTLENGSVSLFTDQGDSPMTVRVKSGFYITHMRPAGGFGASNEDPQLFCEVAQR
jgi:molybdopterin converting factor small subunit